jgi:predicted RNA methylase
MNPAQIERLHTLRHENDITAAHMAANASRFETYRNRHTNGTAPRAVSAFQLFQTPATVAARMAELAAIRPGEYVLEPSAGLGRLLDPLLAAGAKVAAVEVNPDVAAELYRKYEGRPVKLYQRDFLACAAPRTGGGGSIIKSFPDSPPFFSAVVMNPPFHMRADIAHIRHALAFLAAGGRLVGLCLNTRHREAALQPLADYWQVLPAGTFRAEGTDVETVLFRIPL